MQALNSFWVWTGLAALGVAVPIIIHLLYRKHRQQTDWAAMELLRRALVIRSGQVKLEDYLILCLRCCALALVAFALLRPTFSSKSSPLLLEESVGMVVAVDASFSMNHGEHSRYEQAISKAREILKAANQGDPVTLVLMSNRPEVLLRRTAYDSQIFDDVLDEQTKATPHRLSLERNLEQLDELVAELKTPAREVYLVTDAQDSDWQALSDRGRGALSTLAKNATVVVAPVAGDGSHDNFSLNQFAYSSGSLQTSGVARFTAEVSNHGGNVADPGVVVFSVNEKPVKRQAVGAIEPGKSHAVSFFTSFENAGDVRLAAHLEKDPLRDDNTRFAVVNVRPHIRVLCVDDVAGDQLDENRTGA